MAANNSGNNTDSMKAILDRATRELNERAAAAPSPSPIPQQHALVDAEHAINSVMKKIAEQMANTLRSDAAEAVKRARESAQQLLDAAEGQAKEIVARAEEYEKRVLQLTDQYSAKVDEHSERNATFLGVLKEGTRHMDAIAEKLGIIPPEEAKH